MTAKLITMRPFRPLTVVYRHTPVDCGRNYKQVPFINLSGKWLEKAGFNIGDAVVVAVARECLVIKKAAAQADIQMRG